MTSPANPAAVQVIRNVTPSITTISLPFSRFGLIKFGGRATLVRLQSGGVVVFSPTTLNNDVKETISKMGEVKYIVAPDIEHHIFLGPWKEAYQHAKVIGPEGLREKRAKQKNEDVFFDYIFTKENKRELKLPEELAAEFEVEYWDSHANKEIAFLHKPDNGTLIQADLLFNLYSNEQYSKSEEDPRTGVLTKLFHSFTNIHGKGQQRFLWHAASQDKKSFAESAKIVNAWKFERIIPAHGDVIEKDGNEVFRKMFAWHL